MKLFVWLLLLIQYSYCFDYSKYVDKTADFIDPLDPLAALEAAEAAAQKQKEAAEKPIVPEKVDKLACSKFVEGMIKPEECPKINCTTNGSDDKEDELDKGVYYKRVVYSLMRRFERRLPSDLRERTIFFNLYVGLDQHEVAVLRRFMDPEYHQYQDVTEVLSSMIRRVSVADQAEAEQMDFDELFGVNMSLVLKTVASLACVAVITLVLTKIRFTLRTIFSLAMCLFFISIPWDWAQLYKKAVARRASEMALTAPEHCTPVTERTWTAALRYWAVTSWSFADDPCTTYHEAFAVNPILDVSPLEAFTVTLTKFFVNPLQYVGAGLAKFFNELGKGLPAHYAFGVISFVMVLIVLWLIMRMGYQIKLPFYGGLERAPVQQILYRQGVQEIAYEKLPKSQPVVGDDDVDVDRHRIKSNPRGRPISGREKPMIEHRTEKEMLLEEEAEVIPQSSRASEMTSSLSSSVSDMTSLSSRPSVSSGASDMTSSMASRASEMTSSLSSRSMTTSSMSSRPAETTSSSSLEADSYPGDKIIGTRHLVPLHDDSDTDSIERIDEEDCSMGFNLWQRAEGGGGDNLMRRTEEDPGLDYAKSSGLQWSVQDTDLAEFLPETIKSGVDLSEAKKDNASGDGIESAGSVGESFTIIEPFKHSGSDSQTPPREFDENDH